MTTDTCILLTLGTAFGTWRHTAEALLSSAPEGYRLAEPDIAHWLDLVWDQRADRYSASVPVALGTAQIDAFASKLPHKHAAWGAVEDRLCWTIDTLAPKFPKARFLVFIERPESMLEAWMNDGAGVAAEELLAAWMAGAERLCRHVRRYPSRSLVIDVDETRQHPAALAELCKERFGIAFASPIEPGGAGHPHDPMRRVIARAMARAADPRWSELFEELRASSAPLSSDAVEGSAGPSAALEGMDALSRLVELESALREREQARSLEASLRTRSEGEIERLLREREALEFERDRLAAEFAGLTGRQDDMRQSLLDARGENELLLLQMQQAHDRIRELAAQGSERARSAPPTTEGKPGMFTAADLLIEQVRDEPPHRELSLALLQIGIGDRLVPHLGLRLVEHFGHPGLVLFEEPPQSQMLKRWEETGREGERSYMLLVPEDRQTRERLRRMATADWLLLNTLARTVEWQLRRTVGLSARWTLAAGRLVQQLEELPAQLRYRTAEVTPTDDGRALDITLRGVSFGARMIEILSLRWACSAPGASPVEMSIELFAPTDGAAHFPLSTWPVADDGSAHASTTLRFRGGMGREAARKHWAGLSPTDLALVFSLVGTLPDLAAAAPLAGAPDSLKQTELLSMTGKLVDEARKSISGVGLRSLARAVLGRPSASA